MLALSRPQWQSLLELVRNSDSCDPIQTSWGRPAAPGPESLHFMVLPLSRPAQPLDTIWRLRTAPGAPRLLVFWAKWVCFLSS